MVAALAVLQALRARGLGWSLHAGCSGIGRCPPPGVTMGAGMRGSEAVSGELGNGLRNLNARGEGTLAMGKAHVVLPSRGRCLGGTRCRCRGGCDWLAGCLGSRGWACCLCWPPRG